MSNIWNAFLAKHVPLTVSPQTENNVNKSSIIPLTNMGILEITGTDSATFLQSLFTNDVDELKVNQSQLSGFCNPKGRLLALFLLVKRADNYQLILPAEMCAPLVQRLGMYVLRANVQINNISEDHLALGLHHSDAFNYDNDGSEILSFPHPADSKRTICITTADTAIKMCTNLLAEQWQFEPESYWQLLDIQAGLPSIFTETKESFTPQQVNLDLVGGVSFSKGCYPGQEVVARLHYLGTPSRRMFFADAESSELPTAGSEILLDNGSIAGHIVLAQHADKNKIELLFSLKTVNYDKPLFLSNNNRHLNNVTGLASISS